MAIAVLSGCVTPVGGPLDGVVVDATTNQPMQGVFVIAITKFHGADMVGSRSSCTDLEIVRTDAQGRYKVTRGTAYNADRQVMAYAPGFVEEEVPRATPGPRLAPYKGTDEARAASFMRYSSLIRCGSLDEVGGKLLPLYSALDSEHKVLKLPNHLGHATPFVRIIENAQRLERTNK